MDIDYERKFQNLKELAIANFRNVVFAYNIHRQLKLYQLIICNPKGYYFILIKPEIEWEQIKKKIEEYLGDYENTDCAFCFVQILEEVYYCEKCSAPYCDECCDKFYSCWECNHDFGESVLPSDMTYARKIYYISEEDCDFYENAQPFSFY